MISRCRGHLVVTTEIGIQSGWGIVFHGISFPEYTASITSCNQTVLKAAKTFFSLFWEIKSSAINSGNPAAW